MNLPLPIETRKYFENVKNRILKMDNLGLLFNKYFYNWTNDWQINEEQNKIFRTDIEKIKFHKTIEYLKAIGTRQRTILNNLQASQWHVQSFEATTDSRLIIGLGGTSVIETGMTLHPLYGFPYLPGSGLKGLARAYAEVAVEPKPSGDDLREIFGSEDKDPHNVANNRQGNVFFMDGLPTQFPKLELDIMNPHYGKYYQKEKDSKGNPIPPADYLDPVPVTFLAVAAGEKFSFAVYSRNKDLAAKAKAWLIGGLTELGAGGKTNVGYGYFKGFSNIVIETQADESEKPKKPNADLQNKVKSIKNNQTFIEFINGIKNNEIESLKGISFKDKESVINIGLVSDLESVDASNEIKIIIAQKMLEVISPNKKWDEKKQEKFKKLKLIAGADNE